MSSPARIKKKKLAKGKVKYKIDPWEGGLRLGLEEREGVEWKRQKQRVRGRGVESGNRVEVSRLSIMNEETKYHMNGMKRV